MKATLLAGGPGDVRDAFRVLKLDLGFGWTGMVCRSCGRFFSYLKRFVWPKESPQIVGWDLEWAELRYIWMDSLVILNISKRSVRERGTEELVKFVLLP